MNLKPINQTLMSSFLVFGLSAVPLTSFAHEGARQGHANRHETHSGDYDRHARWEHRNRDKRVRHHSRQARLKHGHRDRLVRRYHRRPWYEVIDGVYAPRWLAARPGSVTIIYRDRR
jgi:Ni/Co efflux regulator RcnB